MKNRKWLFVFLAGLVVCAAVAAFLVVPSGAVASKSKDIVGAWDVNISVVAQNASFPSLVNFFGDGNMISDESPSIQETSAHGSWVSTGENRGAFTFVFLIGSATSAYTRGTVSGNYKVDPKNDRWHGTFTIKLVDQDGNELFSDHGTMDGTRIQALP
jgi:hypothetical protein